MEENKLPPCFGELDKVFPMLENGLRQTPESCFFHCPVKTRCLKQAMASRDGASVEEELIDRSEQAGMMTFLNAGPGKNRSTGAFMPGQKRRIE